MTLRLRCSCFVLALVFACGTSDQSAPDGGTSDAVSSDCAPAGTYRITWTPDPGNAVSCPTPDTTSTIGSDGFDPGVPAGLCSTPGCDATSCERISASASSSTARSRVSGPCTGLATGRTLTATYSYVGTGATFILTDNMSSAGACGFHGAGTRI